MAKTPELYSGIMSGTRGIRCFRMPRHFRCTSFTNCWYYCGRDNALRSAIEAVEDDENAAKTDLQTHELTSKDIVVGIAVSGRTLYVIGGLHYAKELKCYIAAIMSDPHSYLAHLANIAISPVVGPQVLTGSMRLKSGNAQKLILNMITTASLILLGKVHQNLMVDVKATNMKLKHRAQQLLTEHHGCLANTLQQSKDLQFNIHSYLMPFEETPGTAQAVMRLCA